MSTSQPPQGSPVPPESPVAPSEKALAQALAVLRQSPDYQVLTRVPAATAMVFAEPSDPKERTWTGVAIDTETTGLAIHDQDRAIEIGMVVFTYNATGILRVTRVLEEREDPGAPLSPEVVKLTGLTDDLLAGRTFDRAAIQEVLEGANLLIAHNAAFDRVVMEKLFPICAQKPWACTQTQIPWEAAGYNTKKLDYLAYRHGLFYDAHRAVADTEALVAILAAPPAPEIAATLELKNPPARLSLFSVLRYHARHSAYHFWLMDLPYEQKDLAKAAGYLWSDGSIPGTRKAWHREWPAAQARAAYLEAQSWYKTQAPIRVFEVSPLDRFSMREGKPLVRADFLQALPPAVEETHAGDAGAPTPR
ncbi:MAG: 3'-5' exonuclease [Gammaproteobacteria bacterium]|nr:3'-5' exonuclease [Gammaproteobacteria bacterium]